MSDSRRFKHGPPGRDLDAPAARAVDPAFIERASKPWYAPNALDDARGEDDEDIDRIGVDGARRGDARVGERDDGATDDARVWGFGTTARAADDGR